jgi:chemotaxis response regulator CheB
VGLRLLDLLGISKARKSRRMLLTADAVRLSHGPRENYARPAIDPLFRTAALHWRESQHAGQRHR